MIKLTKLNEIIKTLEGTPIADFVKEKPMSYKTALISVCELHRPSNPGAGEALKAFDLGIKIMNAQDSLELKTEEVEFLKTIVESSTVYYSIVIGRLLHYLKDIEGIKQTNESEPKVEEN